MPEATVVVAGGGGQTGWVAVIRSFVANAVTRIILLMKICSHRFEVARSRSHMMQLPCIPIAIDP